MSAVSTTAETIPAPPESGVELVQSCSCCAEPVSYETWRRLQYVGLQTDFDGGWLELRNHDCKSTIARQVLCGCGAKAVWVDGIQWMCDPCSRVWGMR